MSAINDARAHLGKAREFLEAAEVSLDLELFSAAASNAVISGINSKDAICLRLTGRTSRAEKHSFAVAELRAAGGKGTHVELTRALATTLGRLLKLKNKSQYQTAEVARNDASKAVEWARKMLEGASGIALE